MTQRVFLSLILVIVLCWSLASGKTMAGAEEKFLLFYANDIEGETEPCG
jgi:hypothetical protein